MVITPLPVAVTPAIKPHWKAASPPNVAGAFPFSLSVPSSKASCWHLATAASRSDAGVTEEISFDPVCAYLHRPRFCPPEHALPFFILEGPHEDDNQVNKSPDAQSA